MATKYATVSGFVKLLTALIAFEANAEGARVLAAMQALPDVLAYRSRHHPVTVLPLRLVDALVVTGPWKRLVFGHPARTDGLVDRNAYTVSLSRGRAGAALPRGRSRIPTVPARRHVGTQACQHAGTDRDPSAAARRRQVSRPGRSWTARCAGGANPACWEMTEGHWHPRLPGGQGCLADPDLASPISLAPTGFGGPGR
ncbi:hypothetical protein ABT158_50795 [Nonomuraea sp. NPDC001636]|uniref:hypothetical protein n=1 Tax=Nonomuraea sp. NPDC001636 TaxID=3154391 RepID=UPI00331EEDC1